ncbi:uncharacterized protein PITG_10978 [Phytophthora infestans T30-4]|uniref:Uncharacterized protein n=1 Tax=Phytophthora infestans (strain T30-4) TaxID=403677 RepID=D0NFV9_PHYIT|nr:uncharacterized protein PITG_10978 [Phytophthora infestans T30-4]EEY57160.1 hypothetical protein PITG_10978 [Phytophthora infestans T30-4]|eukprot:XP_002901770.1 hypothetical protein PITG_10978 [Phytophthora infestans T30-4]
MFGVAALFCRLGLRPHSACALSTQIVANLMGVLYYVAFMNNTHITSYPSEPVLAFGAARLWYEIEDQTGQQKTTALDIHKAWVNKWKDRKMSFMSTYLKNIAASSWWDLEKRVLSDLKRRDKSACGRQSCILSQHEVLETLGHSMPSKRIISANNRKRSIASKEGAKAKKRKR